ncbi:hypothetical protein M514_15139 [Trichuris suis]|uniref:Uncharacterized protein n=1 Tax=Trichuris suis TaxID=68888 RepID=A0A085NTD9_9BILA|nr:hypothetical protein M514_15139 [Trichuris suis]
MRSSLWPAVRRLDHKCGRPLGGKLDAQPTRVELIPAARVSLITNELFLSLSLSLSFRLGSKADIREPTAVVNGTGKGVQETSIETTRRALVDGQHFHAIMHNLLVPVGQVAPTPSNAKRL